MEIGLYLVYNKANGSLEEQICCFAKELSDPAPIVKTVRNSRMDKSSVPEKDYAFPKASAGVSVMTHASGFLKKQKPWTFQNTTMRIFPYNTGGQPVRADLPLIYLSKSRNSSSVKMGIPNSLALRSLEPAFSPTTT